ncbi:MULTISPECIES: helix-turn-helix domain-containing protein [unclassified Chelatococcus]|uniref:helix-turn-helix domain-containing protein n=1 Tax=unclassified Chelatococcus TaxID=2638111 RepID=UPI001BCE55EC|nr:MULTISPECIES: helix-turn-helix domain-containing protein [unclassified Chelatococcus]MBS7696780.1 helix-turn-helix domain-containing protein [Chelatococcus sp. YT9]MBX3555345.1 helix-turn-helix domain-containing protein [Chelatococcus sp.]
MKAQPITLSEAARLELEQWMQTASPDERLRAQCILLAAAGARNNAISETMKLSQQAVGKWRKRYAEMGLDGIKEPRRGRLPKFGADTVEQVVSLRFSHRDSDASGTNWSIRKLARTSGMSFRTVQKIVKAAADQRPTS